MSNNKIDQIKEKINNLREKQTDLATQQQTLAADILQGEADLAAEIERQAAEEARLSEEQRQQRRQLKEKAAARLEVAAKVDKDIKNLMDSTGALFQLAKEVEQLAKQTGKFTPALSLERAKLDVADSVKEAFNPLEIPTLFKHVPAADRKSFLEKEKSKLRLLN
ncbi:MAG: hypothetical protein A4E53_00745 [Pelotomaculum sp. PtaB.Bin104]|nr:MAG: hypothetical protein A4E53_00745 [Pelotomaculum sp. PtaB.Bin104]